MLFCDFINEVPFLYDGINIELNTINIINNNFELYYLEPQTFYSYFRNKLILILPNYYKMIKNEMREELFNLSNNINYRRLADARVNDLLNQQLQNTKTVRDNDEKVTQETSDTHNSSSENNENNKTANKQNPLSIEGSDFESLYKWESSSAIDESQNESESTTKDNSTSNSTQNRAVDETVKNKMSNDIKQLTHSLTDTEELNKGQSILAVEAIDTINRFLMSNNNSINFLIKQLKPLFINCE